jgi:hypothetical protein
VEKFLKNLLPYLPLLLPIAGIQLKARDKGKDGADDAFGDIAIAVGTGLTGVEDESETKIDRSMLAVYNTSRNYLAAKGKLPAEG